jgi:hypothetical protein
MTLGLSSLYKWRLAYSALVSFRNTLQDWKLYWCEILLLISGPTGHDLSQGTAVLTSLRTC